MTEAAALIRSTVDRILRLKEEIDNLNDDIKEVYAEAKAHGLDKTIIGLVVREIRALEKNAAKVAETHELYESYLASYQGTKARIKADLVWQPPRAATMSEAREAYKAGKPISQDFQYHDAHVYFIAFRSIGRLKIGISNDVPARLEALQKQARCYGVLLGTFKGNRKQEMAALDHFKQYHVEREWFDFDADVELAVRQYIEDRKSPPHAPARENSDDVASMRTHESADTHMPAVGSPIQEFAQPDHAGDNTGSFPQAPPVGSPSVAGSAAAACSETMPALVAMASGPFSSSSTLAGPSGPAPLGAFDPADDMPEFLRRTKPPMTALTA